MASDKSRNSITRRTLNLSFAQIASTDARSVVPGDMTLSRDANLKAKTIEALRQYREALVKVEAALEQEEDSARRAVTEMLGDIERAIVEGCTSSVRQNLFQTGQVAVARLSEISYELTEATAKLDASGQRFAALEKQLGYIPVLRAMRAASKDLENCSNGG